MDNFDGHSEGGDVRAAVMLLGERGVPAAVGRRLTASHVTGKKTISEENFRRRERLRGCTEMPKATIRNIVGAVASFERWLWTGPFDDQRSIHEIPPAELDTYLVEFYRTVKTPAGLEYKMTAMQSLRSNLEKYLDANKYPESISKSYMFANSQLAYKTWIASRRHYMQVEMMNSKVDNHVTGL